MLTVLGFLVFGSAFAAAAVAIAATVMPNVDRIVDALFGRQQHFAPLETLVRAERRIAVRRWASTSRPASMRLREAA